MTIDGPSTGVTVKRKMDQHPLFHPCTNVTIDFCSISFTTFTEENTMRRFRRVSAKEIYMFVLKKEFYSDHKMRYIFQREDWTDPTLSDWKEYRLRKKLKQQIKSLTYDPEADINRRKEYYYDSDDDSDWMDDMLEEYDYNDRTGLDGKSTDNDDESDEEVDDEDSDKEIDEEVKEVNEEDDKEVDDKDDQEVDSEDGKQVDGEDIKKVDDADDEEVDVSDGKKFDYEDDTEFDDEADKDVDEHKDDETIFIDVTPELSNAGKFHADLCQNQIWFRLTPIQRNNLHPVKKTHDEVVVETKKRRQRSTMPSLRNDCLPKIKDKTVSKPTSQIVPYRGKTLPKTHTLPPIDIKRKQTTVRLEHTCTTGLKPSPYQRNILPPIRKKN